MVDIAAAALNFFDTLIIAGKYQYKAGISIFARRRISGTVSALGPGVSGFKVGDKACGYSGARGAREARDCDRPAGAGGAAYARSLDRAAGLFVTYGTTIRALQDRAKIAGRDARGAGAAGGTG